MLIIVSATKCYFHLVLAFQSLLGQNCSSLLVSAGAMQVIKASFVPLRSCQGVQHVNSHCHAASPNLLYSFLQCHDRSLWLLRRPCPSRWAGTCRRKAKYKWWEKVTKILFKFLLLFIWHSLRWKYRHLSNYSFIPSAKFSKLKYSNSKLTYRTYVILMNDCPGGIRWTIIQNFSWTIII